MDGISNFDIEEIFTKTNNGDLPIGVFPSNKMNKFLDLKKMMKGKRYSFLIANTDRSNKEDTHWWSILDINGKKDFLLFDYFGIKGLKNFIAQGDQKIKVLKGVENLKKDKKQINFVSVNFVKNSYLKLSEDEKAALSETCLDVSYFLESFAEYEQQNKICLWLLEDPIQDLKFDTCRYFPDIFYENLFFPNSDSILQTCRHLTNNVIQTFLQELFSTNTENNETIIKNYVKQRSSIVL